jgi:hypothetical protein
MSLYLLLGDKMIELVEVSEQEEHTICVPVDKMWTGVLRDAVNLAYSDLEKSYEKIRRREGIQEED